MSQRAEKKKSRKRKVNQSEGEEEFKASKNAVTPSKGGVDSEDNLDKQINNLDEDGNVSNQQQFDYREEPIQLISVKNHPNDKFVFQVHDEGLQYLNSLNQYVAVVSSCGRMRTGKSTLLNYLLSKINNDGVSPISTFI